MYAALYIVTGLAFVAGVAAYALFSTQLSQDIKDGRIPVRAEVKK